MSRNRIVSLLLSISLSTGLLYAQKTINVNEDALLMKAILYDEYKAYENSYQVYKKLFDSTGTGIYLYKEATSSLLSKKHIVESIDRLEIWDKKHPNSIEVRRLLIPLYLTSKQIGKAKREAEFLLEQSSEPHDLDLASNSFFYAGEFDHALALLSKIYETIPRESILLRMVELMDEFTGERKKAIQLLETHRRINIVSEDVYVKLLMLYQKERNVDGILDIYKVMYENDNKEAYLTKIIDAYIYKKDLDGAIEFLEKSTTNIELLYQLYKVNKDFAKAITLIDKLFDKDKDSKWIAEKGVLLFELSEDKDDKKMINNVLSHFEKAIKLGNDDSIYLNYYGYTLIDKEVDIKKGIKIIEDALVQQPNNTYYLDSLAWGYYKNNQCAQAYLLMKRVVDEEGLEEQEIIEHWDAIQQCQ